jgi:perosamine synthetase
MTKTAKVTPRQMIPQIEPWIDGAELLELARAIESTFITEHELTREFEDMTRELTGAKHAIAVCNGTVALFVCLKSLGIGPGDEVIVPDLTFIASANAVILAGATPVLCEVSSDTLCINVARLERLLTERTRAVMPVHLYGQSADMTSVLRFAKKHRLAVIEDAAEAIGVRFAGRHVGTFGDMGIISYYGNKTVTCAEGGMILTNDDALARAAYRMKNHGRDQKGSFIHDNIGFNFSFTDIHAAIGISQMRKMPLAVARKQDIRQRYVAETADLDAFQPLPVDPRCDPVFWFSCFLCADPEQLGAFLNDQGIQTRRFFFPLHLQPCFADRRHIRIIDEDFSVSEHAYRRGICLPSSYSLTEEDQDHIIQQIRCFYENWNQLPSSRP